MGAKVKEAAMTGGESLIKQGMQEGLRKGREEGLRKGREKGREEGARSVLLEFLRFRFGEIPAHVLKRLEQASSQDLERWTLAAGSVRTLDELLTS